MKPSNRPPSFRPPSFRPTIRRSGDLTIRRILFLLSFALAALAAPALDFSQVAAVTIPEGAVESISTPDGEVLWQRTPTARDYVQDGLVAMWDGIENAGWGVHDAAATNWVNLGDQTLYGNANTASGRQWSGNALVLPGIPNGTAAQYYATVKYNGTGKQGDGYTLEACGYMVPQDASQNTYWPFLAMLGGASRVMPVLKNNIGVCDVTAEGTHGLWLTSDGYASGHTTYALVHPAGYSSRTLYVGAVSKVLTKQLYTSNGTFELHVMLGGQFRTTGMEIHCIRLYSRALTAAEVAHNYKIDKERFNLP